MLMKLNILVLIIILGISPSLNSWAISKDKMSVVTNFDDNFYQKLLNANDNSVASYLDSKTQNRGRSGAGEFATLVSSYVQKDSKYYKSTAIVTRLNQIIDGFLSLQLPDGTLDSGGNLQSPPDTGFSLHSLCPAAVLLNQQNDKELDGVKAKLEKFLKSAGNGLAKGGIHTPNHRWVVTLALTECYALYGDVNYLNRANEWLAEGIDIDSDGMYSERSPNYSEVVNNGLLNVGHILNRPYLFDYVKKNLMTTYYLTEENGDVQALHSRRQDQYTYNQTLQTITKNYLFYRYLAIYFNDSELAAITRKIETLPDFNQTILARSLVFYLNNEVLQKKLPESGKLGNFEKEFPKTGLVRIKRGELSASIFGGNDKPIIVTSGRSSNPDFFTFRKGEAFLDYVRMSTSFFSMGFFRADGFQKEGNKYILRETKEAYYYKPMLEENRDANGDYKLSPSLDGRFWSKMDFAKRPKDTKSLDHKITIEEQRDGSFIMDIGVSGISGVNVTLDFCFKKGGKLEGVTPVPARMNYYSNEKTEYNNDYFFKDEYVKYSFGKDEILIGPGKKEHESIGSLEGESYRYYNGSNKGEGMHVYVTGITPFKHTITIK